MSKKISPPRNFLCKKFFFQIFLAQSVVLQVTKSDYRLLQATKGYYRVLQVTTGYKRLSQVTTGYYKHTFQADKWLQIKQLIKFLFNHLPGVLLQRIPCLMIWRFLEKGKLKKNYEPFSTFKIMSKNLVPYIF